MKFSRRSMFKVSAAGLATLAAPQILVRAAQAEVPMSATMPAAFKRFTLGDFEVTVLSDGHRVVPDPQKVFGTNQTEEEVAALLESNYLPVDQMQFTFAPTLVNTGTDLVLFDTGNGEGGREGGVGQTLANLKASGYTPRPGYRGGAHPSAWRPHRWSDGRRCAGIPQCALRHRPGRV